MAIIEKTQYYFSSSESDSLRMKIIIDSLNDIEQRLEETRSEFIFDNNYTMPDSVTTIRLARIRLLNLDTISLDNYPLTAEYYKTMKSRPSYTIAEITG